MNGINVIRYRNVDAFSTTTKKKHDMIVNQIGNIQSQIANKQTNSECRHQQREQRKRDVNQVLLPVNGDLKRKELRNIGDKYLWINRLINHQTDRDDGRFESRCKRTKR